MRTIVTTREMQAQAESARLAGERIAFVPTMGYLHEGHISLMREGRRRSTLLIASIFVNPTQFGANEDLSRYPRDLDRDLKLMRGVPVDLVFTPAPDQIYGKDFQTWVEVAELTKGLCGDSRPGHFRGVTTVVAKLFNIVKPHVALFGQKDFQQLRAIQQMVDDLNFDIEIIGMPTIREVDGLAMSSRNAYLTAEQRRSALALSRGLFAAAGQYRRGVRDRDGLRDSAQAEITADKSIQLEYLEVLDASTLKSPTGATQRLLVAVAAKVGKTRLIDNIVLEPGAGEFAQVRESVHESARSS